MPESTKSASAHAQSRGVALTAPYMHAGQLATLEEVVDLYDRGGDTPASGTKNPLMTPLHLTAQEKANHKLPQVIPTGAPIPPNLLH